MTQINADRPWWGTDVDVLTQMHADALGCDTDDFNFYLWLIFVNPCTSVVCFQMCRLRLIIDCMWKNGAHSRRTGQKQTESKSGTRNPLCAGDRRESNTKYAQPWISVSCLPVVCFCRATTALRHFFTGTTLYCEALFLHLGFDTDARRWALMGHGWFLYLSVTYLC